MTVQTRNIEEHTRIALSQCQDGALGAVHVDQVTVWTPCMDYGVSITHMLPAYHWDPNVVLRGCAGKELSHPIVYSMNKQANTLYCNFTLTCNDIS